jgi:hypothetical protein
MLSVRSSKTLRKLLGAPGRNRTCDTRFRKPLLYPLSYEGWERCRRTGLRQPPVCTLPRIIAPIRRRLQGVQR